MDYIKNATTLTLYVSGVSSKKNLLVYINTLCLWGSKKNLLVYIENLSSVESKKIFPAGFLVLAIVDLQRSQQDSSSESGKGSSEEKNSRKIGTVWRNVSEVS